MEAQRVKVTFPRSSAEWWLSSCLSLPIFSLSLPFTLVSVVMITLALGSPELYSRSHGKQHHVSSSPHKHIRLAWGYCSLVANIEIKVGLSHSEVVKHTLCFEDEGVSNCGTFQTFREAESTIHHQDLATVTMLPYLIILCIFVLGHFKVNNRYHDASLQNILAYYKEETLSNINIISSYLTKVKGVL